MHKDVYGEIEIPEYMTGVINCICKSPNVKSKLLVLLRFLNTSGLKVYSPELVIFSYESNVHIKILLRNRQRFKIVQNHKYHGNIQV